MKDMAHRSKFIYPRMSFIKDAYASLDQILVVND